MKNYKSKKGKKSPVPSFLTKLYQILENQDLVNVVKWSENGKAFVVKNLADFIEIVLPNYFKHNNFASFVRQLNMYDFHKTRNNNFENTFHHKLFARGQKNNLKLIKRKINPHFKKIVEEEDQISNSEIHNVNNRRDGESYENVLLSINEFERRQTQLESNIESISKSLIERLEEHKSLSKDLEAKVNHIQNLENLVILMTEINNEKDQINLKFLQNILETSEISDLNNCLKENEIDISNILSSCDSSTIKLILKNYLDKSNLNISDFDIFINKVSTPAQLEENVLISVTPSTGCEISILKPTNSKEEIECPFKITKQYDQCNKNEDINMFEEINGVTHNLISSPPMSPHKIRNCLYQTRRINDE